MLKRRIIAKFLIEGGVLVKYRQFVKGKRIAGRPVPTMNTFEDMRLDEFMICDLGVIDPDLVCAMTENIFAPVTAAGSIHSIDQVSELIRACGVDKVVIKDIGLADDVAVKYGRQAVVWPIDYEDGMCVKGVPDSAGEVLLTNITRDGMGTGFDLSVLSLGWDVPVVLAGGCGKLDDVRVAFAAGASGVAISSMFFFTDKSPIKLRTWLVSEGSEVRV